MTDGGLPTGSLTFVLTDVPGSTARWEADPDRTAAALVRLDEVVAAAAARFGGRLVKPRGENDSHFLVFADPSGALATAVRLGATVRAEGLGPVRMAVTTGPAELLAGDYLGPTVNHCARLRSAAHPGQVVVGETAARAAAERLPPGARLADLGWHWLKDLDRPLRAFELRHPDLPDGFPPLASMAPPAPTLALPLTSFVGRADELDRLCGALATGAPITVTGPPGVGKSRLAMELAVVVGRSGQSVVRFETLADPPGPLDPAPMPTLVVLDDADHHRAQVRAAIDGRSPSDALSVVTTARTPVGAAGEIEVRLRPLDDESAGRLLDERAEAARPGMDLGASRAPILAALSGIPLAIELAAARLAVLAPEQLLSRLADPARVLSARARVPPRHVSLAEAVAWTLDDLDEEHRGALADLAGGRAVDPAVAERLLRQGWVEPEAPAVLPVLAPFLARERR